MIHAAGTFNRDQNLENVMSEKQSDKPGFKVFRFSEAPTLDEANCQTIRPFTDAQLEAAKTIKPLLMKGEELHVLFSVPGFSLAYAWFKQDYPLPLHSHSSDCLYYVVSGSLKLGTQQLGPRDGFFVPGDTPYTFTAGPEGVEIVEFRHDQLFDFRLLSKGEAYFTRTTETLEALQDVWKDAKKPALNA
jgi:hypothetical protein